MIIKVMGKLGIFLVLMLLSVQVIGQRESKKESKKLSITCHITSDTVQEYFLVKILCDYNLEAEFKAGERWSCDLALNREYTVIVYVDGYSPMYVVIDAKTNRSRAYKYTFTINMDSLDVNEYPVRFGEIFYNEDSKKFDGSFIKNN